MIIVSQDRESIINFDRITSIWIDDNILDKTNTEYEICADRETLGYYKTEERAKEILQEIVATYKKENCEFENGMYHQQQVYEMPEK